MPRRPPKMPNLCPTQSKAYPQVFHTYMGADGSLTPNILCSGLDKPKSPSYNHTRYIEALGHKWRACSGASCIPKRTSSTTQPTSYPPEGFESTLNGDD